MCVKAHCKKVISHCHFLSLINLFCMISWKSRSFHPFVQDAEQQLAYYRFSAWLYPCMSLASNQHALASANV